MATDYSRGGVRPSGTGVGVRALRPGAVLAEAPFDPADVPGDEVEDRLAARWGIVRHGGVGQVAIPGGQRNGGGVLSIEPRRPKHPEVTPVQVEAVGPRFLLPEDQR